MQTYHFKTCNSELSSWCHKPLELTVRARDEAEARHRAMTQRWGPPRGIYGARYAGKGLELLSVE